MANSSEAERRTEPVSTMLGPLASSPSVEGQNLRCNIQCNKMNARRQVLVDARDRNVCCGRYIHRASPPPRRRKTGVMVSASDLLSCVIGTRCDQIPPVCEDPLRGTFSISALQSAGIEGYIAPSCRLRTVCGLPAFGNDSAKGPEVLMADRKGCGGGSARVARRPPPPNPPGRFIAIRGIKSPIS